MNIVFDFTFNLIKFLSILFPILGKYIIIIMHFESNFFLKYNSMASDKDDKKYVKGSS